MTEVRRCNYLGDLVISKLVNQVGHLSYMTLEERSTKSVF